MKDLHSRKPVDTVASRVIQDGEHWEPRIGNLGHDSEFPIPTAHKPRGAKDMRGVRVGRLTVIGYWGRKASGKGTAARHRWVVRCDCGAYSVRRVASLQKSVATGRLDCCQKCRVLENLRA